MDARKVHAPGIGFPRSRYMVCRQYSVDEEIKVGERTIVRTRVRGDVVHETVSPQPAQTFRPLQVAAGWDGVTCRGCLKHKGILDANRVDPFAMAIDEAAFMQQTKAA